MDESGKICGYVLAKMEEEPDDVRKVLILLNLLKIFWNDRFPVFNNKLITKIMEICSVSEWVL